MKLNTQKSSAKLGNRNEEAFYLDKQIQKGAKGTLLEYVLKNRIDMNKYEDFVSMAAELSEKVEEKLAYMMKLACEFNNLVYMAKKMEDGITLPLCSWMV